MEKLTLIRLEDRILFDAAAAADIAAAENLVDTAAEASGGDAQRKRKLKVTPILFRQNWDR